MGKELEITANNEFCIPAGTCPVCKQENVEYGSMSIEEELIYSFTCNVCGTKGSECYRIEYRATIVNEFGVIPEGTVD